MSKCSLLRHCCYLKANYRPWVSALAAVRMSARHSIANDLHAKVSRQQRKPQSWWWLYNTNVLEFQREHVFWLEVETRCWEESVVSCSLFDFNLLGCLEFADGPQSRHHSTMLDEMDWRTTQPGNVMQQGHKTNHFLWLSIFCKSDDLTTG